MEYEYSWVIPKQLTIFIINKDPAYSVNSPEVSKPKSNIKTRGVM